MKIIGKQILIKPLQEKEVVISGLIIPAGVKDSLKGEVLAVGQIADFDSGPIVPGDVIAYTKHAPKEWPAPSDFTAKKFNLSQDKVKRVLENDIVCRIRQKDFVINN